jgi:DNA-binding response OmpR family regulator
MATTIRLDQDETSTMGPRPLLTPVAGISDQERATVLIVEDDPTLLSTLAFNLGREGYRVLIAGDGEHGLALALAEAARLDLVLLDVMLPGISGFDVLRRLRTASDVPVLILSARGETDDKVDGFEFGADDYIAKPFVLRELLARIRATVRRRALPAARPPSVLHRGPLRIELERRNVRIDAQEVHLRPKEYGLLTTLALEPGKIFSRQDLLDLVWGQEVIVDERTVDVHISWLRAKLAAAGLAGDAIRTVYGAGYRFTTQRHEPVIAAVEDSTGSA